MTGYTEKIESGYIETGKEFLILCCRAFGFDMEHMSKEMPPAISPDPYFKKRVESAEQDLEIALNMTLEEAKVLAEEEYKEMESLYKKSFDESIKTNQKYEEIREEILKWDPPTENHLRLKEFALEQIDRSIHSLYSLYEDALKNGMRSPSEYRLYHIKMCEERLARVKEMYEEHMESVNERNQWLTDFKNSFQNKVIQE